MKERGPAEGAVWHNIRYYGMPFQTNRRSPGLRESACIQHLYNESEDSLRM